MITVPLHRTATVIKAARREAGLTQVKAARRAGVGINTWRAVERGERWPYVPALVAILTTVQIPPSEWGDLLRRA